MATRTAVGKRVRTRRPRWVRIVKLTFAVTFLLGLIGTVILGVMFAIKLRKAEEMMATLPDTLKAVASTPSVIVTHDGKTMFRVSAQNRMPVQINQVPEIVKEATLAAEDKRFYEHHGIDYIALARALFTNIRDRGTSQGGSTITMQIVKRVFTSPAQTFDRKMQDMALAVTIERKMSKNQILALYLNEVYYGESAYGVKAAADVYFGKSLDKLTIGEAALLARCVRRPSDENPFRNPGKALANRDVVLGIMQDEGMITQSEYEQAKAEKLVLAKRQITDTARYYRAPYAVRYSIDQLHKELPDVDLTQGGYRIETTIDPELQTIAEEIVLDVIRRNKGNKVTTGAFVLMDREGRIRAMVGGKDFKRNQFNVVTQGRRQPGSAFKPFIYASALAIGSLKPNDSVSNARYIGPIDPTTGKAWTPKNSQGRYGGNVSIRSALQWSYNMPVIRVFEEAGVENVRSICREAFGFKSEIKPFLSSALGASEVSPLEMLQGYSVFQLRGNRATPFIISRVIAPDGTVLKEYTPNVRRVMSPQVAEFIDECLRAVVRGGTGSKANSVSDARGKTGTTSDNKDAWFCGYTNEFVGIGWIANEVLREKGGPLYLEMGRSVYGGKVTVDIWTGVMKRAEAMARKGKLGGRFDPNAEPKDENWDGENMEPAPGIDEIQRDEEQEPDPELKPGNEEDVKPPNRGEPGFERPPGEEVPPPDTGRSGTTTTAGTTGGNGATAAPGSDPGVVVRRPDPPKERPRVQPEEVFDHTEVCADSGLRANMYCPETVIRSYRRGLAPRRTCRLHRP